tara:strand:- start:151 stop:1368 length:1218 start_codon:yes stop_codon:yes gene_type:complete
MNIKSTITQFIFLFLLISCVNEINQPILGKYRAEMITKDGSILPFNFEFLKKSEQLIMKVENGKETLIYDEIRIELDSIKIFMPPFDAVIIVKAEGEYLNGRYLKEESGIETPFKAFLSNQPKFNSSTNANIDLSGKFKTEFRPEKPYPGLGLFTQNGNLISGTFKKNSGDTRYLSGIVSGDSIYMSTFDGAHPYLIKAVKTGDTIKGNLYYQSNSITKFWMVSDDNYELPNKKELTKLKEGYNTIDFSFKNTKGEMISLSDDEFKNKVVVIQIMGTWCPNCLDETQFFLSYLKENKFKDLSFIALSFEAAKTEEKAMKRVQSLIDRFNIPYPVLLAQYGSTDTKLAAEKLPMLDGIRAYPTTILVDKKGNVKSIYTGFDGPATGNAFEDFKNNFNQEILELLNQ